MRDQVHKAQNFTQNFDANVDIFVYFFLRDKKFSSRRSREMKSRDEIETVSSRLVSHFFKRRPSRYRPLVYYTTHLEFRLAYPGLPLRPGHPALGGRAACSGVV